MYQTCSICVMDSSAKEIVFDSDLICNFCKEASKEINKYKFIIDKKELKAGKAFAIKKLGFSENEFDEIMSHSPVPHDFFKTDETYIGPIKKFAKFLKFKNKIW